MNRIATTLNAFAVSAVLLQTGVAADATVDQLSSRIIALESRITSLEAQFGEPQTGSYSYTNQATLDATNAQVNEPVTAPKPAPVIEPRPSETYVIQDGDKISTIAEKFTIDRKELLTANRLSEGQPIYIGETLLIPGVEGQGAVADAPDLAPAKEKSIVVGDTRPAVDGSTHTVAKGDTLIAVSRKYNTSVEGIKSANGLRSDVITLGQTLTIPKGAAAAAASAPANETTTQLASTTTATGQKASYQYDNELLKTEETYGYYTVRKGDNLYALGQDFFTNMAELQRLNRLGVSTIIHPGDDLIVPTARYNTYHNKAGVASN